MTDRSSPATAGVLSFGKIPRLPDDWWTSPPPSDPQAVWTIWDPNTYYLWGANSSNYRGIKLGDSLQGESMAGNSGPSRGRAHPHYVGIIDMDFNDMPKNDDVFDELEKLLKAGKNVVVPTLHGRWSLGTGLGTGIKNWGGIQAYILNRVYLLGQKAGSVNIPDDTYWPDIRGTEKDYPVKQLSDLQDLVKLLSAASSAHSGRVFSATGDR